MRSSVTWTADRSHMIVHVTDLDPRTQYDLYVYGQNTHGKSESNLQVQVTTVGKKIQFRRSFLTYPLSIY